MGYYWLTFNCAACGNVAVANPDKVLCLVLDGQKEPICRTCADRWNQIHRIDKGLPPVDYGDAYDNPACDGFPDDDNFYPDSDPGMFVEF
jgi:hypothetical protein